ncbi:MAG: cbb3-type cytochrome c oxidase subunit 3 [Rhodospirillales bacterium]|nr:cbb3-type cytochrome c oxidase subunit 3 [Rhodospirillales bacterium]
MDFTSLSHFAQTWGLVYLVVMFVVVLVYALRPGAKSQFDDAARIPFKED